VSIKIDVQGMLGDLDIVQRSQLPYATSRAMSDLRPAMQQGFTRKVQAGELFREHVPYTENSGKTTKVTQQRNGGNIEYRFSFYITDDREKQDPSKYLFPIETGTEYFKMAFNRGFEKIKPAGYKSPQILLPNLNSPAVKLNDYGNMKPAQYRTILKYFDNKANNVVTKRKPINSYFFVPRDDNYGGSRHLPAGIYLSNGPKKKPTQMFFVLDNPPQMPKTWSLSDVANELIDNAAPFIFDTWLERAMK
jgi:hypothetical protein